MKLNKLVVAAFAVGAMWSCQKEDVDVSDVSNPDTTSVETKVVNFMGTDVEVDVLDDETYQLGDMIIFKDNLTSKSFSPDLEPTTSAQKLTIEGRIRKWTNNTVIYVFERGVPSNLRDMTMRSMKEWSDNTAIRFKERTNESNYVSIGMSGESCNCAFASLGMNRGGVIKMGTRTTEHVMVHEFGHTLGFPHEQNRPDRDQYITVNERNISSGGRSQYFISRGSEPLTTQLDYKSIMMYSSRTFGNGNGPTMTRKDNGRPVEGGGRTLTALDIEGTNKAYPGRGTNPTTPTTPTTVDICDDVSEWQPRRYSVGDKVTYRGFLFERDFTGWENLGKCGTSEPKDICDGVDEYVRGRRYGEGDKVTFRGDLYEVINNIWELQGKCGA